MRRNDNYLPRINSLRSAQTVCVRRRCSLSPDRHEIRQRGSGLSMWGSDSVRESILGLEGAPSPFKAERQRRANSSATSLQAVIKTFCLNFNFVCSVLTHTPQTRFCLICNSVTASYNIVYRKNIFSPRARNVGVCVSISMLTNPNWTIQYIHTARLLY